MRGVAQELPLLGRELGGQVEDELDPQAAELGGHAVHGHALVAQREHLVRVRAGVRVGARVVVGVRVRVRVRPGGVSAWWGWLTPALDMVTAWPSR